MIGNSQVFGQGETSPITVSTNKTIYENGDFLIISGTATPNEELDIWLVDSNNNIISQTTITVDSTGSYSVSLETWNSSQFVFGEYAVGVWSLIDDRSDILFISFVDTTPVVTIVSTIITLDSIPSPIPLDYGPFMVTGQLTTTDGTPLSGKPVWMNVDAGDGRNQSGTTITDSNGYFVRELFNWQEDDPGNWEVYLLFDGDADYDSSISASRYITVEPVGTTSHTIITLDSIPSSIPLDYGPFLIRGSLTDLNGIPISGKTIWMQANSDDGSGQSGDTITDSNGYFERELYFWHESDPGNWEVYVYFDGDADYDSSISGSRYITVETTSVPGGEISPITVSTNKSSYGEGDFLLVSGTATPNEELEIILFANAENVIAREFITVDSSGSYSTSLETFDSTYMVFGEYGVLAASQTDDRYNVVYFEFVDTTPVVTIVSTIITLDSIPSPIPLDYGPFMVTGQLTTTDGTPLSGKPVWMNVDAGDGRNQSGTTITDSNGYFVRELFNWQEDDPGNWEVYLLFDGDADYDSSISASRYITVEPVGTTSHTIITLDSIPSSIPLDYGPFLIRGSLTDLNGIPISGKTIWMQANSDDGSGQSGDTITDSNGYFERELYFWHESDPGNWEVYVYFDGDADYDSSISGSRYITVETTSVPGGEISPITVSTNKSSYGEGDFLLVSGNATPNEELQVALMDSNQNVFYQTSILVSSTGIYDTDLLTWQSSQLEFAEYIVMVWSLVDDRYNYSYVLFVDTSPNLSGSTSLTFNIDPTSSTITEDYPVTFYGTLTTADGQYGIPNVTIYIKDDVTFGSDKLITTATTDNNGEFYTTWTATLRNSGAYDFYAVFNGNSELNSDRTTNHKVTVIQDTPPEPVSESEAGTLIINSAEYEVSRYDPAEVSFSGTVFEYSQGSNVLVDVIFPNGGILEQKILVSSDKSFGVSIFLDDDDPVGVYTINAKYRDKEFSPLTFTLDKVPEDVLPDYPPTNYSADIIISQNTGVPGCEILNNCYSPYSLFVNVGDTIEWYNADSAVHTVSQGSPSDDYVGGEFDSGMLMSGESFFHTFENGGTFDYFDMMHPWMMGTVQVNESVIVEGGPENAGALGSAHVHAGILVKIFGDEFDFSAPAYQIKSPWIHFEESDGDTIHRHATGVELEYLFNSLSIGLDDQCYVFPDGKSFCTNDEYSLKYFINEKLVSDIRNYVIQEDDEILIIFDAISSKPIETKTGLIFDELPKTVTDGELISFTGQLLSSNGTPLEGKTIYIKRDISFGSDDTARTVITNENGYFTAERSYTLNKGYDESKMLFYAKWDGDSQNNSFRTQNQLVTLVLSEPTTTSVLTLDTPPSQIKSGDLITFSGSLLTESGEPIVDKKIVIKDEDDFSGDDFIASAVTDNSGNYSVTVTARDWDPDSGATEVYAVFNSGTNYYTSDRTKSYDVIVSGSVKNTTITFDKLPKSILEGETVTFSGQLLNDDGTPLEGKTIYITQDVSLGSDSVFATLTTDENGYFTEEMSFTLPRGTENLGAEFYAKWDGDSQNNSFRTQSQMIIIKASDPVKNTTVTLDPLPNKITEGESITFSGQLLTTDGIPLEGRTIYIKDDYDFDTDSIIKKTTTDSNGKFSISWSATVRYSGSYDFYAVFEGEEKAKRDRSLTYGVYVTAIQSFEPIRVFSDESIFEIGDSLVIYGDATPNEELQIALMDPNQNIITSKTIQVSSSGSYSTTLYNWKQSTAFGDYVVVAWSEIDQRYDGFWISFIEGVPQVSETKITLDRPPSSIVLNEPIVFSGKLQTIDGNPIKNANVIIATIPRTGGTPESLAEGYTDSSGRYSITWYAKQTSSSGMTPVYAYYGGNQFLDSISTSLYDIKIEKPSLSVFTEKSTYDVGEQLLAYGYGNPNDRITVELKSAQGKVVNSEYSIVSSDGNYHTFFNLDNLSNGQYTIKVISALYAISDSVTIQVESKIVTNEIDITGNVHYNYNKIPLEGIKAVLDIGAQQHVDYADSAGNFEFENIGFNPQLDYTLHFEMTDGKSFNFVDANKYDSQSHDAYGQVIFSKYINLSLDNSKSTNHFSINLGDHLPYDYGKSYLITKGFDTQMKVVNFYSKVLNERPPIINIFLFESGSSYRPVDWDPNTGKVQGYWQPLIRISDSSMSAIGMEYTHYVQDHAYKKMGGLDRSPYTGNHYGFGNPSSGDSWVEGVGTFMPAVIADWYKLGSAGKFSNTNLEENKYKPNSNFFKWLPTWLDEEYSIATLLWDMYDSENEQGDNTTMRINEIWKLIIGFDSFQQHNPSDYHGDKRNIKYFKDFYDYLYDESNMSGDNIDDLFISHGIPQGWSAAGRP